MIGLGEACALLAAVTWSVSVILFKRSEAVSPAAMNLFKNVVAFALLALTMLCLGVWFPPQRSSADWARLVVSGVLGIAVADTLIFMALRRLGAGLLAVVDCVYAPTIVLLSMLLLGEDLGWAFAAGAVLVVAGVLVTTTESSPEPEQEHEHEGEGSRRWGIACGLTGIVAMAFGVILAKPVLTDGHLVEVTLVRLVAGIGAQLLWIAVGLGKSDTLEVFRKREVWRTLLPASVLGSYVAMLFWLGGFKWAPVSVASVLNQLSSVFTLILAWIFLREPMSGRRAFGTFIAVGGAALVLFTRGGS
jgi:drug/metabolite transporter (DMT)-like permease